MCVFNDIYISVVLKSLITDVLCIVLDFWYPLFCDKQFGQMNKINKKVQNTM